MEIPKSVKSFRSDYDRAVARLEAMAATVTAWRAEQGRVAKRLIDLDDRRVASKLAGKGLSFDPVERLRLQVSVADYDEMLRRFESEVRAAAGAVWDVEGAALAVAWRAFDVSERRAELAEVDRVRGVKSPVGFDSLDPAAWRRAQAEGRDFSYEYEADSRNTQHRAAYVEWWVARIMGREPGVPPQWAWLRRGTLEYERAPGLLEFDPKQDAAQMAKMQAARPRQDVVSERIVRQSDGGEVGASSPE